MPVWESLAVVVLCHGATSSAVQGPAPFPLPPGAPRASVDPAVHKVVRMAVSMQEAERFYARSFTRVEGVTVVTEEVGGQRTLVLTSRREADGWGRAVLTREGGLTVVRVTPYYRLETVAVEGEPPPWVRIVIPRSAEARRALHQDHLHKK